MIFVFGSNLAGIHGAGAALYARKKYGAEIGVGEGRTGMSYGIPTKDHQIISRSLEAIEFSVDTFLEYATDNPRLEFQVTKIGCGLAGFTEDQIAPMFVGAPYNCNLPEEWLWCQSASVIGRTL